MKICKNCEKFYNNFKFCPECGRKTEEYNGISLINELDEGYKNVYGTWKVATGNNLVKECLGTYTGFIDEIALVLAFNSEYYKENALEFTKVNNSKDVDNKEVIVRLGQDSHISKMRDEDRIATLKELFKDRPVEITDGGVWDMFKLIKRIKQI